MPDASGPLLRLKERVIFRPLGTTEACLLDLEQKTFFTLNRTGLWLLEALKRGATHADLVNGLAKHFAIPRENSAKDVDAFLAQLRTSNLLQER